MSGRAVMWLTLQFVVYLWAGWLLLRVPEYAALGRCLFVGATVAGFMLLWVAIGGTFSPPTKDGAAPE